MSSQAVELRESYVSDYQPADGQAFEYRPVPVLAVISMVLGVLSLMAFFGMVGMVVAAFGILISVISLLKIVRSQGELGGRRLAILGLACSMLFLGSGVAYQRHLYMNEVPAGFARTSFTNDISKKGFVTIDGQQRVHPDIEKLVGQTIFVKGFMYPTGQVEGLDSFLLVKDSGTCCFGGEPALTDMIGVVMQDAKTVDYYQGRVSVAGEFELNPELRRRQERALLSDEGPHRRKIAHGILMDRTRRLLGASILGLIVTAAGGCGTAARRPSFRPRSRGQSADAAPAVGRCRSPDRRLRPPQRQLPFRRRARCTARVRRAPIRS